MALEPTGVAGALRNLLRSRDRYGRVSWVANYFGISRPTLYRLESDFLEVVCHGPGRRCKSPQQRELERLRERVAELEGETARLREQQEQQQKDASFILEKTRFWLIGFGLPARSITRLLNECFGAKTNRTKILQLTRQYACRASQLMEEYFWPLAQDVDLDEIYIEDLPLYIASDPRSLAILKTSLENAATVQGWSKFIQDLRNLQRVTSDRGQGITGASSRREGLVRQSDIFHPKLLWQEELTIMENRCYALMAKEEAAEKVVQKTQLRGRDCRGAARRLQRIELKTRTAIELFDEMESAIKIAFQSLRITTTQGTFNSVANARDLLLFARTWIQEHLPDGWGRVKNAMKDGNLFTFLKELEPRLTTIPVQTSTPENRQLVLLTLATCWEDQASRRYRGKPVLIPPHLDEQLQSHCGNLDEVKSLLFGVLDKLHRASSGVECINSRVGFYRYSKRRFSADYANLIAIWHNLSPFKEGKRVHQSPAQILDVKLPTFDLFELFAVV